MILARIFRFLHILKKHTPRFGPRFIKVSWNKVKNELEFRRNKTILNTLPWNLILETTVNCNLSCPMCREYMPFDPQLDMPLDLLESAVDRLAPTSDTIDVRSQGEAMVAKTWDEMLSRVARYGCKYEVVCNGTRLSEDRCKQLAEMRFRVVVSIDGAKKETFEKIRRGARFEHVIAGVRMLSATYRETGLSSDRLAFQVTAQRDNLDEIPDIVRLAKEVGFGEVKVHGINNEGGPGIEEYADRCRQVFEESIRLGRELGLHRVEIPALNLLPPSSPPASEGSASPPLDTRCREPWKTVNIAHDGNVYPCCILPMDPLGNLNDQTFEEIWNGAAYQELRKTINGPEPPNPCRTCPAVNRGLS